MRYDVADRLGKPDIKSKVDLIEYLIGRAEMQKPNELFKHRLADFLFENERTSYSRAHSLIGPKYALGCLIARFLYQYVSVKDFKRQASLLKSLLDYVQKFRISKHISLKKTEAIGLIHRIEEFGLPGYFFRDRDNQPLKVYIIPYEHAEMNAGYLSSLNSIVSYKPREKDLNPGYVFVHEIGHLLTYNLTGDPGVVPDSFIEFNNKFNPSWKGDLVEVFVDLFSIAVMMDTEFAYQNPFLTIFTIPQQKIIKEYFLGLVKNAKYKTA